MDGSATKDNVTPGTWSVSASSPIVRIPPSANENMGIIAAVEKCLGVGSKEGKGWADAEV